MSRRAASRWLRPRARRPARQAGITLIELLVSMTILGVITTMILVSWFALQNSFAYSLNASHAREAARDAVSRLTVAIRDAQATTFTYPPGQVDAISSAKGSKIVFNTSYQRPDNANIPTGSGANNNAVVQACFIYVESDTSPTDGKIYYVTDLNNNGLIDELAGPSPPVGKIIVDHVVNNVRPTASGTSVFTYTYFADDGTIKQVTDMTAANISPARIYSVQIHVLVDLDPSHAPVYMDLQSTAQPRNMRPST